MAYDLPLIDKGGIRDIDINLVGFNRTCVYNRSSRSNQFHNSVIILKRSGLNDPAVIYCIIKDIVKDLGG